MPEWVFCTEAGTLLAESRVRKAFTKILTEAKLPLHFSPHSLRHAYASLLPQQGESPAYVQRQLGHASITLTADTYGEWLPMGNKAAVNRLDEAGGLGGSSSRRPTASGDAHGSVAQCERAFLRRRAVARSASAAVRRRSTSPRVASNVATSSLSRPRDAPCLSREMYVLQRRPPT